MRLQPGERLVVTGAGGGVGLHAIQLGWMLGASVMGVDIGEAKAAAMLRLGADAVVDPTVDGLSESIGSGPTARGPMPCSSWWVPPPCHKPSSRWPREGGW
jgi:NADPH:quinone reductase-like Zn-dependent oxidoreductase